MAALVRLILSDSTQVGAIDYFRCSLELNKAILASKKDLIVNP